MRRLSRRDPDALARIFNQHAPAMQKLLWRITRDRDLSDDLLQEAFLKVWTRAAQFDKAKGSLRMWLNALVRNLAVDHIRSAGSRFSENCMSTAFPGSFPDADHASEIYLAHWIANGLRGLPPHEKRVLELAYFSGYSQLEIARLMHTPLGTVKGWMRSGLGRLRHELSPAKAAKAGNGKGRLALPGSQTER